MSNDVKLQKAETNLIELSKSERKGEDVRKSMRDAQFDYLAQVNPRAAEAWARRSGYAA